MDGNSASNATICCIYFHIQTKLKREQQNMYKAAIILLVLCIGHALSSDDVIVKNLKIYSNCEEFFIKAFCYSPTPLGASNPQAGVSAQSSINSNISRMKVDSVDGELTIWE